MLAARDNHSRQSQEYDGRLAGLLILQSLRHVQKLQSTRSQSKFEECLKIVKKSIAGFQVLMQLQLQSSKEKRLADVRYSCSSEKRNSLDSISSCIARGGDAIGIRIPDGQYETSKTEGLIRVGGWPMGIFHSPRNDGIVFRPHVEITPISCR
jgi:hypothetical protein